MYFYDFVAPLRLICKIRNLFFFSDKVLLSRGESLNSLNESSTRYCPLLSFNDQ